MKYTLIAILLLTTISGMAQSNKQKLTLSDVGTMTSGGGFDIYKNYQPAALINNHSDTIIICEPLQVHFIKIGSEVYQIIPHSPTIEKAQPPINPLIFRGTTTWPSIQPVYNINPQ